MPCNSYSNDPRQFKMKRCALVVLIFTTIVEMVALMSLVGYWRVLRDDILSPRQQQMCLEWHSFVFVDDEETDKKCPSRLIKKFNEKKNSTSCCGVLSDVLDYYSTKVDDKYNSDANPETTSLDLTKYRCKKTDKKQPKAHLTNISVDRKPVPIGMSSNFKLLWNPDSTSYANFGLRHVEENGTIYVEEHGHYYISSQLETTITTTNGTEERKENTFKHYVHLISSKGKEKVILENVQTQCEMASDVSETTSVLGSVFHLGQGDQLYVATSHPQNVVSGPQKNHFSIHSVTQ